jgi:hypothetical protein
MVEANPRQRPITYPKIRFWRMILFIEYRFSPTLELTAARTVCCTVWAKRKRSSLRFHQGSVGDQRHERGARGFSRLQVRAVDYLEGNSPAWRS